MKIKLIILLVLAAVLPGWAESPLEELAKRLTKTIQAVCPEAKCSVSEGAFTAKYDTLVLTVHNIGRDGRIAEEPRQHEGPNNKGFILSVSIDEKEYNGPSALPGGFPGPYYQCFVNQAPAPNGKYYWIRFAYGNQLDPKVKEALQAVIPGGLKPIKWVNITELTPDQRREFFSPSSEK